MHLAYYHLGLIGYPVEHSISPVLHNAALAAMGLAGEYRRYSVPPLPEGAPTFAGLITRMKAGDLAGLNVTIPHKQTIMQWTDTVTPAAQAIGAVNTLYTRGNQLIGDNTDAGGFILDLQRVFETPTWRVNGVQPGSLALVLGAGGSARAVIFSLRQAGWQIAIAARVPARGTALAASLGLEGCQVISHSAQGSPSAPGIRDFLESQGVSVRLVVNTTPSGMLPDVGSTPWPQGVPFPGQARFYDLVYNPGVTRWVAEAQHAGHPAANGLGMLVEQAALALERWTGLAAPRSVMFQAAVDALEIRRM